MWSHSYVKSIMKFDLIELENRSVVSGEWEERGEKMERWSNRYEDTTSQEKQILESDHVARWLLTVFSTVYNTRRKNFEFFFSGNRHV